MWWLGNWHSTCVFGWFTSAQLFRNSILVEDTFEPWDKDNRNGPGTGQMGILVRSTALDDQNRSTVKAPPPHFLTIHGSFHFVPSDFLKASLVCNCACTSAYLYVGLRAYPETIKRFMSTQKVLDKRKQLLRPAKGQQKAYMMRGSKTQRANRVNMAQDR